MAHIVKVIIAGDKAAAVPPVCSIANGCQVEWVKGPGVTSFKVEFTKNGSPFGQTSFDHAHPNSGGCNANPGAGKKQTFSYWLSVNGGTPVDPDVVVDGGP